MKRGWIIVGLLAAQAAEAQNWVAASGGTIPALAVPAGADLGGATLYACRVTDAQGVTQAGKISSAFGGCVYYAGQAIQAPNYQVLTDSSVDWRSATNGAIPSGSYNVASGGQAVYICRAYVENSRQVGQLRAGTPGCEIEFGATGGYFNIYEVLWNPWVAATDGTIPSGALQGGTDGDGVPLYICRGTSNGGMQLGKIRGDFDGCHVGLPNSTVNITSYEVLTSFSGVWQVFNNAVPNGGAFFAGSGGGQAKYICRFTIGGTTALTPGQTGSSDSQGQCRVEYGGNSKNAGSFEALRKNETPGVCQYSVSPTTINASGLGGVQAVTVNSGCGWVNFPSAPWLKPDKRNGTGNGTFNLQIDPNPTTSPRTGSVSVGGQTITINQAAGCSYSFFPNPVSSAAEGGPKNVTVTTTSGCSWVAATPAPWIHIIDPTGVGTGTFTFNVDAHPSSTARTATISVGGQNVTVNQAGACIYTVNPTLLNDIPAAGYAVTFTPTSNPGCSSTVSAPAWTTVTPTANPGQFNLTVHANTAYASRTGQLTIGTGQVINLTQFGQPCTVVANPSAPLFPALGDHSLSWSACPTRLVNGQRRPVRPSCTSPLQRAKGTALSPEPPIPLSPEAPAVRASPSPAIYRTFQPS